MGIDREVVIQYITPADAALIVLGLSWRVSKIQVSGRDLAPLVQKQGELVAAVNRGVRIFLEITRSVLVILNIRWRWANEVRASPGFMTVSTGSGSGK